MRHLGRWDFEPRSSRLEVDPKALPFRFRVARCCLEDISCRTRSFINITSIRPVHCRPFHTLSSFSSPPPLSRRYLAKPVPLSYKRVFTCGREKGGGGGEPGIFHRSSGIHFRYAWKLGFNEFIPQTKLSCFNLPVCRLGSTTRLHCTRAKISEHARFPHPRRVISIAPDQPLHYFPVCFAAYLSTLPRRRNLPFL